MSDGRVHYSIVIPVYFNEGCLLPLFRTLTTEVLQANPARKGAVVFVADGSGTRPLDALRQTASASPSTVTLPKLTRNFGQTAATLAGYEHARGECVVTISADGQEPAALVNDM